MIIAACFERFSWFELKKPLLGVNGDCKHQNPASILVSPLNPHDLVYDVISIFLLMSFTSTHFLIIARHYYTGFLTI
jgi:hypothetical protein